MPSLHWDTIYGLNASGVLLTETECSETRLLNFRICDAIRAEDNSWQLLVAIMWGVAIFMYFGITFLIAALEIMSRNNSLAEELEMKRRSPEEQAQWAVEKEMARTVSFRAKESMLDEIASSVVMEPHVGSELTHIVDAESMAETNTISSYSALTARGGTALTVFTVLVSMCTLFLTAIRDEMLAGYGLCGNVTIKMIGGAAFFFTGLMATKDPRTPASGGRLFNQVFTGFVRYSACGSIIIKIFHLGGVFIYVVSQIVAMWLQGDSPGILGGAICTFLLLVLIVMAILQNEKLLPWRHRNLLMFMAELLLVFAVAAGSIVNEVYLISFCMHPGFYNYSWILLLPMGIVVFMGVTVWCCMRRQDVQKEEGTGEAAAAPSQEEVAGPSTEPIAGGSSDAAAPAASSSATGAEPEGISPEQRVESLRRAAEEAVAQYQAALAQLPPPQAAEATTGAPDCS